MATLGVTHAACRQPWAAAGAASCRLRAPVPFRPAGARSARPAAAPLQRRWQHGGRRALLCSASSAPPPLVDVEAARKLLDGASLVLDVRPAGEYESGRITKPPRRSANVPFSPGQDAAAFVAQVSSKFPSRSAKLIVMCNDGGDCSAQATLALLSAGYTDVAQMEGGYTGYCAVWSPSGKRRPPAGRWVSTGKEALKSGLNIPGVAESYDEGGNLKQARYAQGLAAGQELPPSA